MVSAGRKCVIVIVCVYVLGFVFGLRGRFAVIRRPVDPMNSIRSRPYPRPSPPFDGYTPLDYVMLLGKLETRNSRLETQPDDKQRSIH